MLIPEDYKKAHEIYGSLPKTDRERAMWFAGYLKGQIEGKKALQEALQTLLGLDERFENLDF